MYPAPVPSPYYRGGFSPGPSSPLVASWPPEKTHSAKELPATKSVVLANEKDTFLGLEGPSIFLPTFCFLIWHKFTGNFFASCVVFLLVYFFLRIYLRDKPKYFLRFILDWYQLPKHYEHRFHHPEEPFRPECIFV